LVDLPLNAKGMVVVSLPVLALLASLIVFVQFQRQARSAQGWVDHTYQVRSELRQISLLTVSAEAEARGYLLTGDKSLLERYREAREKIPVHVAALRRLISDNPAQLQRLRTVEAQVQRTVQAFSAMSDDAGSNAGTEMSRLSGQLSAMEAEENTLLERRTAEMDSAERRFDAALAASAVIGLLGGFISALIFTTRIGRRVRRLAGDARRMARGEPIQEDTGSTDEIAQLGHTLKHTSELLAARNMQLRAAKQDLESRVLQRTAELMEANEQLQRVNEVRQAVIGSSPLAIWAVDLHGRVKFWNPAAERIFGWKEGEVLDRPLPVIAEEQQD
jgi:CHASE3 domain sensor protein